MYKHILLPVDGSSISRDVILQSVAFAKENGAMITGMHVIPEFHMLALQADMMTDTPEKYLKDTEAQAKVFLAEISDAAAAQGVPCETLFVRADHPFEEIVEMAEEMQCDLICMASHGRKGMKGFLLGSETQKVLTHSQIPVLVYR